MKPASDRLLLAAAGLLIALLTANVWLTSRNTMLLRDDAAWVAYTHGEITRLENVISIIKDAETGYRGYVLTGDMAFLEPFVQARAVVESRVNEVEQLTHEDPSHKARLSQVRPLIADKIGFMEEGVALRKNEGFEAAQHHIRSGRGKALMDEIQVLIGELVKHEEEMLVVRDARTQHTYRIAMVSGLASGVLALATLVCSLLLLRRHLIARAMAGAVIAEQAERLRTTLASIGDAVIATDTAGNITNLNAVAESLTGWTDAEATGQPLEKVFHIVNETTRKPVDSPVTKALREGVIVGLANHTVLIAKNGSECAIDDSAAPIRCKDGEIVGCVLVFRDVSVGRHAEHALRTSEARKSAILTSALDCIISMDHEGRIMDFNPAAELTFGYSLAEVLGRTVAETIIPPEYRDAHAHGLARFMATGTATVLGKRIELPAQRADGSQFPCELAITMTRVADHPPFFTAYLRDITERKQSREALRQAAEELEQADRSKDEFLAMLAHELRNPLTPMRNAAAILQAVGASAEECAHAQRILGRQMENMSRMIDDLLDISRITQGKIALDLEPVALEAVLTAAVSLVRHNISTHGQHFDISLPAQPVFLNADATRLEQVFGNLLTNACKYSGDGSNISLSAEVVEVSPPSTPPAGDDAQSQATEREIVVTVRDDGHGIDPELLPHIFDLFVQSSRALDRAHGGLGIGLTLVQRLVNQHGGHVEAHSEGLGKGSEFTVHLPILNEAPTPAALAPITTTPETPRRMLIVDDNTDAAYSLATLQEWRGHDTRTVFTGPDAVTAAAEFLPEVLLLDIGLPGMDGFQVARQIRAMPALAGALIIAMSGYGRDEDREEAKQAGFDEYLVKPLDLKRLSELLHNHAKPHP